MTASLSSTKINSNEAIMASVPKRALGAVS